MHDEIPSRILNGWLRLEEDLFHLQVLSSLPPKIPICFIIANDLPKRNRSRPTPGGCVPFIHSMPVTFLPFQLRQLRFHLRDQHLQLLLAFLARTAIYDDEDHDV